MTLSRRARWAGAAIVAGVGIWLAQMFIGLNYYGEGDGSYPWFLRLTQWAALALLLGGLVVIGWSLLARFTRRQA
jgi:hypothetical protein